MKYFPQIDGLRALAVGVVVLFHAGLGFTGGFVGVDVFFVISGFLITRLVVKDLQAGSFSMVNFWERRIRRIIPALYFMVGAVLCVGWLVLLPPAYAELGASAVWQTLLAANIYFWRHTGYFAGESAEMPLLHTWSLAVEEQFYLVVPLLLAACWSLGRQRKGTLFALVLVILVGSFLLSVYGVAFHRSAAFFLLPFRAWELALGSALALCPENWFSAGKIMRGITGWLGLAMVVCAAVFYNKQTPFPGLAAVLPCAGTACIIWSTASQPGVLGQMLAWRPLVFVGLISYSLYLWHWPIFAMANVWALEPLSVPARFGFVALAVAMAIFSYYAVELPFRRRKLLPAAKSLFVVAAVASGGLLLGGWAVYSSGGVPQRVDPATRSYSEAVKEMEFIHEVSAESVEAGSLPALGEESAPPDMLLWGDSHAMALAPAVDEALKQMGRGGRLATHSSTAPLIAFSRVSEYGLGEAAPEFADTVINYIRRNGIGHVVLAAHWSAYPPGPSAAGEVGDLREQLLATVRTLSGEAVKTWVVLGVPLHKASIPKVLLRASLFGEDPRAFVDTPQRDWNGISGTDAGLVDALRKSGATVVDPRPSFLDSSGNSYMIEFGGRPLYRDEQHLTPFGARSLLTSLFLQNFRGATSTNEANNP